MKDELNDKQRTFCEEYLKDFNATQAAIRAGYSKKTAGIIGFENLKKPKLQNEIKRLIEKRSERTQIDADYVLTSIKEVAERCMQKAPVMIYDREEKCKVPATDEEGNGVWIFDSSGANRALELLGRHLKLFTDKFEHGASPDTLEKLIQYYHKNGNGNKTKLEAVSNERSDL